MSETVMGQTIEERLHHEVRRMDRALRDAAIAASVLSGVLVVSVAWLLFGA